MRLKLISCEVFHPEFMALIPHARNEIVAEFLPKALHDTGRLPMRDRLQQAIDRSDTAGVDAILLGYGLCNYGIAGLAARRVPLIVTRAHDCMTLFFGGLKRYETYFVDHPGTYFLTPGWIDNAIDGRELSHLSIQHANGMDLTYKEFVDKYGEDNGSFLWDQLARQTRHYKRLVYLRTGVEKDGRLEARAREQARERGLAFSPEEADLRLIRALLDGPWNADEFLTVAPGRRIALTYDGGLVAATQADHE